ncbi:MAG: alcohol dehydrogenase catalytic domain-containing protein [Thermoleophilia bacterium]|nr:alcohol dehydrogenase catalytic domain-containing protein [Thermoleophilia bacterium]
MRAVRLVGPRELRVDEVPDPEIQAANNAVVQVTKSAICGADLLPYWGHVPGFEWGTVMGHEFVGVVKEVGSAVTRVRPGDRVVCSSMTSCGECWACRHGMQPQCEKRALFGFSGAYPRLDGGQAEQVLVPNANRDLWPLPPEVSDEAGVFVADILSTAYRGVQRANVGLGDTVAVVGCGPVGLMAILTARLAAGQVIAVDTVPARLDQARSLGAATVDASREDPVEVVMTFTEGRGADVVLECAGGVPALTSALQMSRVRGTVSVIGAHFEPDFPLDAGSMFARETQLVFSIGAPTDDREAVIDLIRRGRIDPTSTISHRMSLEEAPEAYRLFEAREATKVVLTP